MPSEFFPDVNFFLSSQRYILSYDKLVLAEYLLKQTIGRTYFAWRYLKCNCFIPLPKNDLTQKYAGAVRRPPQTYPEHWSHSINELQTILT